eukprot:826695-Prorocentrum_lima.AAC.1
MERVKQARRFGTIAHNPKRRWRVLVDGILHRAILGMIESATHEQTGRSHRRRRGGIMDTH